MKLSLLGGVSLSLLLGALLAYQLAAQDTGTPTGATESGNELPVGLPRPIDSPVRRGNYLAHPTDEATSKLLLRERQLSEQCASLAMDYANTTEEAARSVQLDNLTKLVAEQFEVRQGLHEKALADLDAQLKRLRAVHLQRAQQQDRIIQERVQQLLRDTEGLGWNGIDGGADLYITPGPGSGPAKAPATNSRSTRE